MKILSIADVTALLPSRSGARAVRGLLRHRGMSLIEIMVVITLIGLVAAASTSNQLAINGSG
jgi:prepilin-type N-terminal cleavage/methylation domain-containing protein